MRLFTLLWIAGALTANCAAMAQAGAEPQWNPGSRVLGLSTNGKWYPARVGDGDPNSLFLYFDGGDASWVGRDRVKPFSWGPGTLVQCRQASSADYAWGRIASLEETTALIRYDDGEVRPTDLGLCRSYTSGHG